MSELCTASSTICCETRRFFNAVGVRCGQWVVVMSIAVHWFLPAASAGELSGFGRCSLRGDYVYENVGGGVASFGVLRFDGAGNVEADLRVNAAVGEGGRSRTTRFVTGRGTYMVAENGIGTVKLGFKGMPTPAVASIW
jgi:hypothetical protein